MFDSFPEVFLTGISVLVREQYLSPDTRQMFAGDVLIPARSYHGISQHFRLPCNGLPKKSEPYFSGEEI
jgi:hypothetical protein